MSGAGCSRSHLAECNPRPKVDSVKEGSEGAIGIPQGHGSLVKRWGVYASSWYISRGQNKWEGRWRGLIGSQKWNHTYAPIPILLSLSDEESGRGEEKIGAFV